MNECLTKITTTYNVLFIPEKLKFSLQFLVVLVTGYAYETYS